MDITIRLSLCVLLTLVIIHSAEELGDDILGQSTAIGPSFMCAISQRNNYDEIGGQATCWHDGVRGREKLTSAPKDETMVQIIAGSAYGCGLNIDQRVVCWGSFKDYNVPGFYTQISGADMYGCGIKTDSSIGCWGSLHAAPPQDGKYVQVDCHSYHCCALTTEGHASCWGKDFAGDAGVNKHLISPIDEAKRSKLSTDAEEEDGYDDVGDPEEMEAAALKHTFIKLVVGQEFTCGITTEKYGLCWGEGIHLADHVPEYIPGPLKHIALGDAGMCALYGAPIEETLEGEEEDILDKNDNVSQKIDPSSPAEHSMKCWGFHLPNFLKESHLKDLEVDQVVVGATSACAVTMDSELKCWGIGNEVKRLPQGLVIA